ncbi:unnamed protein product [Brassica oleracea]
MIGRADIEGSKSNVAMNAWLPQASYPCGLIGHAFTMCRPSQTPHLTMSSARIDPPKRVLGLKEGVVTPPPIHGSSSTGSSFPADSAKHVPLAVVSLDSRRGHRISLVRTSSELAVRRPGKAPERAVPSPSPGRHEAVHSRHVSGSSSPPTVDGYGSILPTSLAYIVPSTRGCSPWRPDAVMSTTGRERHSVLRIFKGRRECTGHHATCGALPAAGPYLRLSRFQGGQAICTDGRSRPGSRPRFCSDRRALLLIEAWLLPRRPVFRPYTQVRRMICTSVSLRASTRVSSGFAPLRHSSPSFGSRQACSHSNPSQKIKVGRLCTREGSSQSASLRLTDSLSVFQDGSNGEPTGRRPEHADAEARREARAADHD